MNERPSLKSILVMALLGAVACSDPESPDGGVVDTGFVADAAGDSGLRDAAASDLGTPDSTPNDTGADAGADAGDEDASVSDAGDPCARTGLASFRISNLPSGFVLPAIKWGHARRRAPELQHRQRRPRRRRIDRHLDHQQRRRWASGPARH